METATFGRPTLTVVYCTLSVPLDAFCQSLVDTMENTPGLRFFWNTVKSLLQGKVVYTPDTLAAHRIVKEVSAVEMFRLEFLCSIIWYW